MSQEPGVGVRLNEMLKASGMAEIGAETARRFEAYLALLISWNARLNLTAIRSKEGILSRHFLESIACAGIIPKGVETLLDFGSGAGFPGIPIALCRPEISVTLAESQAKKAAFLQEALRTLELFSVKVHAGRAETLGGRFDCVAMRAVDRMDRAVSIGSRLVRSGGWLVLMSTNAQFVELKSAAGADVQWLDCAELPLSTERIIAIGARTK